MTNPYTGLPGSAFWRRAVANVPPFALDPMLQAPFTISRGDRVATAGSCFAQHIARVLKGSGYTYFVTEERPEGFEESKSAFDNYGVFSARYGNIYTTRQLRQLIDRAFGDFTPELSEWVRADGRRVDPYRPQVEPEGFADLAALETDRANHLAKVRQMFRELDVFVFTLGLTEGWRVKADGAALPLAPGVSGGNWDPAVYEFVNYTVEEVTEDLISSIDRIRQINSNARIIITVSPVPLIATFEPRHVLASTVYSKSVLRVAAEVASRQRQDVVYFPSYELITSSAAGGRYFAADLRSVTDAGVSRVMSVFFRHLGADRQHEGEAAEVYRSPSWDTKREFEDVSAVVCDEAAIDP